MILQCQISLAAAVAFTNGTFAVVGSTFNGCQCVALAYTLAMPAVPVPVSFCGIFATVEFVFKMCQWSAQEFAVEVPAATVPITLEGIYSLIYRGSQ
ncbi:MAG: hypothetical protein EZS28_017230 [Streblomastix strix]|uniref:Uncharacterized protein n=1 Tax=Streblomastix strix TaxID=222440 RepID=A0A5J4VXC2_9EUKA|nr:MAG: hypothetical protein EZS28_017230 [Streblomastix strix]